MCVCVIFNIIFSFFFSFFKLIPKTRIATSDRVMALRIWFRNPVGDGKRIDAYIIPSEDAHLVRKTFLQKQYFQLLYPPFFFLLHCHLLKWNLQIHSVLLMDYNFQTRLTDAYFSRWWRIKYCFLYSIQLSNTD